MNKTAIRDLIAVAPALLLAALAILHARRPRRAGCPERHVGLPAPTPTAIE